MSAPPSDPASEFVIELFGVLIGAFLGFVFGILIEKRKKHEETKEIRQQMISSLITELKGTQDEFKTSRVRVRWDDGKRKFEGDYAFMTASACKSAIDSGNIRLLPIAAQEKLEYFYITVERSNDIANQIEKFYATPVFTHKDVHIIAELLAKQLEDHHIKLMKAMGDALSSLENIREE